MKIFADTADVNFLRRFAFIIESYFELIRGGNGQIYLAGKKMAEFYLG